MDWNMVTEFIDPRLMIVAAFLYVIGAFLKLHPKFKNEWAIPYILLAVGVVYAVLYVGFVLGVGFCPESILVGDSQGAFSAALAVFTHQLYKQGKNKG